MPTIPALANEVARLHFYAPPAPGVIARFCRGPSVRELVTELRGGAVCW